MIFYKDNFIFLWSKIKFLVFWGMVGVIVMIMSIYVIKYMFFVDVRVIFYILFVYIVIIVWIFFKEFVSKFDVVVMILSIGGVVLIVRFIFLFGF